MAEKEKDNKKKVNPKQKQQSGGSWIFDGSIQRKKWVTWFVIGVAVIFVLTIFVGYGSLFSTPAPAPQPKTSSAGTPKTPAGGETKPILVASRYTGTVAQAYQAAAEIPDILDKLYCYCECEMHSGHKSLKSCFTDEHGANCDICINEALMAKQLHDQGQSVEQIKAAVDQAFAQYGA